MSKDMDIAFDNLKGSLKLYAPCKKERINKQCLEIWLEQNWKKYQIYNCKMSISLINQVYEKRNISRTIETTNGGYFLNPTSPGWYNFAKYDVISHQNHG